jgi:type IV secretory pathway VirD2 relaxase
VRGVTEDGKTLNIAGDYIACGIRERASEIVTRELGRQTELEITKQLEREVDADRFTRLDRMLIAEQQARSSPTFAANRICATRSARTEPC